MLAAFSAPLHSIPFRSRLSCSVLLSIGRLEFVTPCVPCSSPAAFACSLLRQQERIASVIAKSDTVTKFLDTASFARFVAEDSRFARARVLNGLLVSLVFECDPCHRFADARYRFTMVIKELVNETERTRAKRATIAAKAQIKKVVKVDERKQSTKITPYLSRMLGPANQVIIVTLQLPVNSPPTLHD
jgi:hypothetical protein